MSPLGVGIAVQCLFGLAEKGVRVIFVTALSEGWLYVGRRKLLLLDEGLSDQDQDDAARRVLSHLRD